MTNNEIQYEIEKAIAPLQQMIADLTAQLYQHSFVPANNVAHAQKEYLTIEDVSQMYGIKKSMQAKLRMNKSIPYSRPAGAKIVVYPAKQLSEWFQEWRAC